jgi:hypothetical protein
MSFKLRKIFFGPYGLPFSLHAEKECSILFYCIEYQKCEMASPALFFSTPCMYSSPTLAWEGGGGWPQIIWHHDSLVLYILYYGGWDVNYTKYGTRLNKQYDPHIFMVTGWQICQPLIPGPSCSYILARHNTLFTPTCISLLFAPFLDRGQYL